MVKIDRIKWGDFAIEIPPCDARLPSYHSESSFLHPNIIKGIYADAEKKVVVVRFGNDHIEKVKCDKNDDFDVIVGASIGICRYIFGSHVNFYKRIIDEKTVVSVKKTKTQKAKRGEK